MKRLPLWIRESLLVAGCFALVYGGANALAGLHAWRIAVHLPWEARIPFIPAFAPVYLSISPMMTIVAYLLRRDADGVRRFRRVLVAEILIAGVFFVVIPADLGPGFPQEATPPWKGWMEACRQVGLAHNLLPSLHVAFAASTAWHAPRAWRPWLMLWAFLVLLATLLLHLHHLLDVAGGILLALIVENRTSPRTHDSP